MSNEVVAINQQTWTPEQMKLITDVVARGATPDELKLFLYRCQNMQLDPLKPGQIYFIKYGTGPGTIVVGIEGFRARAAKTGRLSGIKRGALRNASGHLVGAWAEVYRTDWKEPAREEVPLAEYNTGNGNWAKMPETMIKKVAEAAALRMAFPDELGGTYTKEEMEQAEQHGRIVPEQPGPNDGVRVIERASVAPKGEFTGSWHKRNLHEIPEPELRRVVEQMEAQPSLAVDQQQWLERAQGHLATLEGMEPSDSEEREPVRCECGTELTYSQNKGKWYCPNFKNASVKHIKPMTQADYDAWSPDVP